MDEALQQAILGNVGKLVTFRVGTRDAKILAEGFYPGFGEQDLVSLPRGRIYLRLMIDRMASRPFSAIVKRS